ncbi:MAG: hypothetical protein K2I71_02735, partial [Helicobacter sp.]|nr:hypothetical protein [Helicobacter sp.]
WTPLKEVFSNTMNSIQNNLSRGWNYLRNLFSWNPLELITSIFTPISEFFEKLFGGWIASFEGVISKITQGLNFVKDFFGFGKADIRGSLERTDKIQKTEEAIHAIPLAPSSTQNNINVAFTGGINVQTTDGKIPENSQLQRDIQREVEMALKKAKENERDRGLSDIDF